MAVVAPARAALRGDLKQRGMLDETLVVLLGEFGRTAKVNATAGRDHWAVCYSALLAGGGIQGGRVHGVSDKTATYPDTDPVSPWDTAATVYHLLGEGPASEYLDYENRPMRVSRGEPIPAAALIAAWRRSIETRSFQGRITDRHVNPSTGAGETNRSTEHLHHARP